jgi:hypothetical protein
LCRSEASDGIARTVGAACGGPKGQEKGARWQITSHAPVSRRSGHWESGRALAKVFRVRDDGAAVVGVWHMDSGEGYSYGERLGGGRAGQSTTRWPPPEAASRSSALAHFQPTHTKWAGRQLGRPPRRRHDCSIVSGPKLGRADRNCRPSHAAPPALISRRRRRQLSSCEPPLSAGPKLRPRAAPLGNPSVQNLSPSPSSFVPFPPLASGDSLSGLGLSQNRVSVASSLSAEAPRSAGPAMAAAETMQGGKSFFVFSVFCDCHLPVRAILCFGRRNWGDLRLLVS